MLCFCVELDKFYEVFRGMFLRSWTESLDGRMLLLERFLKDVNPQMY
jgi:hypothetical protein